jgi:hypothetical protein
MTNPERGSTDQVDDVLAPFPSEVRALALQLRHYVLTIVPAAAEMADPTARIIGYGFGTGYRDLICTIMPTRTGVNLGIARAMELPDPEGLLEGTGKLHRHIKFKQPGDLKRSGVRQLLVAAVAAWRERVDGTAAKRVQPASSRRAARRG